MAETFYKFFEYPPTDKEKNNFKQRVIVRVANLLHIPNDLYKITFSAPFDDDCEPNEATVEIYNLIDSTIADMKKGYALSIDAGYGEDHGYLFFGIISSVNTRYDGVNKITTVTALDGKSYDSVDVVSQSFKKGTKATTILRNLAAKVNLPIGDFQYVNDYTYKNGWTVDGNIIDEMNKIALHIGSSVYINKHKLYIRPLSYGVESKFILSPNTGLIGSPTYFEETNEVSLEDMKYNAESKEYESYATKKTITTRGYNVTSLLQYRISTASIITINSKHVNGSFRVRKGTHRYDGNEMITEMEVVFV